MELSFGMSSVPTVPALGADSPYLKGKNPLTESMPRATTVAAQIARQILLPTSIFGQVETFRHFVSRTRLVPVTPARSERDEKKRSAAFVQTVIVNKSEGANSRRAK